MHEHKRVDRKTDDGPRFGPGFPERGTRRDRYDRFGGTPPSRGGGRGRDRGRQGGFGPGFGPGFGGGFGGGFGPGFGPRMFGRGVKRGPR